MRPKLTAVTLGVKDLKRSLEFYKDGLCWPVMMQNDNIVFFNLDGIIVGLYPRDLLAKDAHVDPEGTGFSGITLAINVDSEKRVDEMFSLIELLGAKIVKKAKKVFWGGYSGYFADPDGHLWEIVFNPHWKVNKQGNVLIPPAEK